LSDEKEEEGGQVNLAMKMTGITEKNRFQQQPGGGGGI
jgi:hypothetical protein